MPRQWDLIGLILPNDMSATLYSWIFCELCGIMDDGHVQFLEEGETPCYVKWLEYGALIVVSNNDTTKPGP